MREVCASCGRDRNTVAVSEIRQVSDTTWRKETLVCGVCGFIDYDWIPVQKNGNSAREAVIVVAACSTPELVEEELWEPLEIRGRKLVDRRRMQVRPYEG